MNGKFPYKLLIFLFLNTQLVFSQQVEEKLSSADSLFKLKKYTQAFQIYEDLYKREFTYTPQTLIKMAFIQEGLGNYTETLYYLNNYYLLTNDKNARQKMESLAEKHKLKGYEYSDLTFILSLLKFYNKEITFFFLLFISIFVIWIAYRSIKYKSQLKVQALFVLLVLVVFQTLNFFIKNHSLAIISKTSYLMTGPSAAADIIEVAQKGDKVRVIGEEDVWLKVSIDESKGYIKKGNLLLINP